MRRVRQTWVGSQPFEANQLREELSGPTADIVVPALVPALMTMSWIISPLCTRPLSSDDVLDCRPRTRLSVCSVGFWSIATFRGDAAIRSLSERSGHQRRFAELD
jgi:hypothetical protein